MKDIKALKAETDRLNAICGGSLAIIGKGYGEFPSLEAAQAARDKVENAYVDAQLDQFLRAEDYDARYAYNGF